MRTRSAGQSWRRGITAVALVVLVVAVVLAVAHARGADEAPPASAPARPTDPAVVHTSAGDVRGIVSADHRMFAGIPYAAPPLGPLRFAPPAPAVPWPGVHDADKPGPRCLQDPGGDPEFGRQTSEDCLTLNVWTPRAGGDRRPVMVWIHGGAFVNGSSGIYDSSLLAARGDIVVVTINYRLGAAGFLAHPALGPAGDVGNYGLQDQQAALRWVRDNAAAFGGDPAKVTVAGESAGGMSVCDHLVAPASAGLFRAAIIMSGPCQAQADLATAERTALEYAKAVGCDDAATAARCLRALPAGKLREPVWNFGIGPDRLSGPVSGTTTLPVHPVDAIRDGRALKVPVLIGTTRDEFTLFVALRFLREGRDMKEFSAERYPALLTDTFGADAPAVEARYPLTSYPDVPLAYSAAVTDGVFACLAERMSDEMSPTQPVYAYEFNDREAPAPEPLRTLPFPVGASHSLELRYLFEVGGAPPLNSAQQALSDQMIDYWSAFVTDGSPDVDGQPNWPALDNVDVAGRMSLRPDGSRVTTDFEQIHQCAFWAGLQG